MRVLMRAIESMSGSTHRTKVLSQSRVRSLHWRQIDGEVTNLDNSHGKVGVRNIRGDPACVHLAPGCESISERKQ